MNLFQKRELKNNKFGGVQISKYTMRFKIQNMSLIFFHTYVRSAEDDMWLLYSTYFWCKVVEIGKCCVVYLTRSAKSFWQDVR